MDRRSQPPYRKIPRPLTSHTWSCRLSGNPFVRAATGAEDCRRDGRAATLRLPLLGEVGGRTEIGEHREGESGKRLDPGGRIREMGRLGSSWG
jgi:hypothetical protein